MEYVPGRTVVLYKPYISRVHTKMIENVVKLFLLVAIHTIHTYTHIHPTRKRDKKDISKEPLFGWRMYVNARMRRRANKKKVTHVQCATGTLHILALHIYFRNLWLFIGGMVRGPGFRQSSLPLSLYCSTCDIHKLRIRVRKSFAMLSHVHVYIYIIYIPQRLLLCEKYRSHIYWWLNVLFRECFVKEARFLPAGSLQVMNIVSF